MNFCFQENKYQWLARIYVKIGGNTVGVCGGTLVASKYVITAAQCTFGVYIGYSLELSADEIFVRIGDHDQDPSINFDPIKVKTINRHPDFDIASLINNIAILELEEEVDLNVYATACIATEADATTFDGETATVVGWGSTEPIAVGVPPSQDPQDYPTVPHEVDVPVIPADSCIFNGNTAPNSIICTGSEDGGKGPCYVRLNSL